MGCCFLVHGCEGWGGWFLRRLMGMVVMLMVGRSWVRSIWSVLNGLHGWKGDRWNYFSILYIDGTLYIRYCQEVPCRYYVYIKT